MPDLDIRWETFEYKTENKTDTFEDMCRRLFTAKYLKNESNPHTNPNMPGLEVEPVLEPERSDGLQRQRISFQSKYSDKVENAYRLFKDSAEKVQQYYNGKVDRVYLFSNQALSTANQKYYQIIAKLREADVEAVPVCGKDLLDLLNEFPDIAKDYFVPKSYRYDGSANGNLYGEQKEKLKQFELLPIRKLSDNLWVNWKTRRFGNDRADVLPEDAKNGNASSDSAHKSSKPGGKLSPASLRLLSVLVQGEGAVVCWDELYRRGIVMHWDMEELKQVSGQGIRRHVNDYHPTLEEEAYAKAEETELPLNEEEILQKALSKANERQEKYGLERKVKEVLSAIRKLYMEAPPLAGLVRPAGNGKGFRIILDGMGIESAEDYYLTDKDGVVAKRDWRLMSLTDSYWEQMRETDVQADRIRDFAQDSEESDRSRDYRSSWLRRCYAENCCSFEQRVSNATEAPGEYDYTSNQRESSAGNSASSEADVFGDYKMVETYTNAYAETNDSDGTEALLDFVEKWYYKGAKRRSGGRKIRGGRIDTNQKGGVLVLYGQPGDGKTTFCKKAVYAKTFEGWMADAPHVLRINLNPQHAGGEIFSSDGMLDLSKMLCLYNPDTESESGQRRYCCNPASLGEESKGSLIILDGYDELAGSLENAALKSAFRRFCENVRNYFSRWEWKVIITSRKMCIEQELEDVRKVDGVTVAAFAPMTEEQQELMVDRMAELQENDGNLDEAESLRDYQEKVLPNLRETETADVGRLLAIPTLFRMIISCRFGHIDGIESSAELYSRLFYALMDYKDRGDKEKRGLLRDYEEIAARIFNYNGNTNGDTCPYGEEMGDRKWELVYIFLTKNNRDETGHLGFLHRSFYQYFLASYLVSGIKGDRDFVRFFRSLRAYPIIDVDVWRFVKEIINMKRRGADPFSENGFEKCDIEKALQLLNGETLYAGTLTDKDVFKTGEDAKHMGWETAEQAVKNLMYFLSAASLECRENEASDDRSDIKNGTGKPAERQKETDAVIDFGKYANVCELLRRGKFSGICLEGMDLSGANLVGADFSGADLQNAMLVGANLTGANLEEAVLTGANLNGACLDRANLRGANLVKCRLEGASFVEADLTGSRLFRACFQGANLERADLTNANLTECSFDGTPVGQWTCGNKYKEDNPEKGEKTNLRRAVLRESVLIGAHLEKTHLEGAILTGANLERADLRGADLTGASLRRACLADVHLESARLVWADLEDAVLKKINLTGAQLAEYRMGDVVLDGARIHGTGFEDADLVKEEPSALYDLAYNSRKRLCFGQYWWSEKVKRPLEWRILTIKEGRALLITDRLIDCQRYHNKWIGITWESCDLRKWMNEVFIEEAFSEAERIRIARICIDNKDNPRYRTMGGNPTWDRIFALSIEEADTYFRTDEERQAGVTPYAKKQDSDVSREYKTSDGAKTGWWWLRSPGFGGDGASCVDYDGGLLADGLYVDFSGGSVRPALWLNL